MAISGVRLNATNKGTAGANNTLAVQKENRKALSHVKARVTGFPQQYK